MTFFQFLNQFPDEKACVDYYLNIRYPDGVRCSHCGNPKVYQRSNIKVFDCPNCYNTFSPFKDTIFEKSRTDMRKWFYAIHLFLNGKKGVSAMQLQREIGVTYKTAWRMLQQIRLAMAGADQQEFFYAVIEMDETYVGGKPRKDNDHHDGISTGSKRGRGTEKTPVVGAIDRFNKSVYAKVCLPNEDGKRTTFKQLMEVLETVSKPENGNVIVTDENRSYRQIGKQYRHFRIDHRQAFSDNNGIHTNTIESFWAILKRGVYGVYHHISVKYMQRYIDEFCFRYNNRDLNMFDKVLKQAKI